MDSVFFSIPLTRKRNPTYRIRGSGNVPRITAGEPSQEQEQDESLRQTQANSDENPLWFDKLKADYLQLVEDNKILSEEKTQLQHEVRERESHIFSLQPCRRDLTIHEAKKVPRHSSTSGCEAELIIK